MNRRYRTPVYLALAVSFASLVHPPVRRAHAQPAPDRAAPTFAVASVRLERDRTNLNSFRILPGGQVQGTLTLRQAITRSYEVFDFQVTGGPAWVSEEPYTVIAKAASGFVDGPESRAQVLQMFRHLLSDRFGLVLNETTRELPVFELRNPSSSGSFGPKLTRVTRDCAVAPADPATTAADGSPPGQASPSCGPIFGLVGADGLMKYGDRGQPLSELLRILTTLLGRPVHDRTGLSGHFDFELTFSRSEAPGLVPLGRLLSSQIAPDAPLVTIPTAVREQLGLRLETVRVPMRVLEIARVHRPMPD